MSTKRRILILVGLVAILLIGVLIYVLRQDDAGEAFRDLIDDFGKEFLLVIAAAILTLLIDSLIGSRDQEDPTEEREPERQPVDVTETVDRSEYLKLLKERNRLANRWNTLVRKFKQLRIAYDAYSQEAREQRDNVYGNRSIIQTALAFSFLSVCVTVLWPPSESQTGGTEQAGSHMLALLAAVVLTSGFFVRRIIRNTRIPKLKAAWATGMAGIALSGFIALSVSLPYQWDRMVQELSPIPDLEMPYFIMLVRLAALPIAGFSFALAIGLFTRRQIGRALPAVNVSNQ